MNWISLFIDNPMSVLCLLSTIVL